MSQSFTCGDTGALVSFVYDECEPELREPIARHLEDCASCSSEVEGLGWTRGQLGAWTPPLTELGFQMHVPALESRLPWWRAPLPAWAQAAAAVLIFAAGLSLGAVRQAGPAGQAASAAPDATPRATPVSQTDLAQLEERLKSEMTGLRTPEPTPAKASTNSEEILRQVHTLLDESEERQRREFTLRSVELARDFEAQRRVDLATVRETVGQLQGVTGTEIRQTREAIDRINNFIRVSQQSR